MIYKILKNNKDLIGEIKAPASKSESNRVLIIQALSDINFEIENLSDSDDTIILQKALKTYKSTKLNKITTIDIGDCGTAMRFLSAFLSIQKGEFILTGSNRIKQRPIGILADALKELGAKVNYYDESGYPPLVIEGSELTGNIIELKGNVSSQFVSALLLIAPVLPHGLSVILKEKVVSAPYIEMTLAIMKHFGIEHIWKSNIIKVNHQQYKPKKYKVNGDWTAASYWYEMAAFADNVDLKIKGLYKNQVQGDEIIDKIFESFNVKTTYETDGIRLTKHKQINSNSLPSSLSTLHLNFSNNPDIAQTLAVTCAGLNQEAHLSGLDNLTIKECDRVEAIISELSSLSFNIIKNNKNEIIIKPVINSQISNLKSQISTYNDHRMAMAFAPLALKFGEISIKDHEVVNKSYPSFWKQLKDVGFNIKLET